MQIDYEARTKYFLVQYDEKLYSIYNDVMFLVYENSEVCKEKAKYQLVTGMTKSYK